MKPHPDYRPDVNRAVFVQGRIDQQLIDRLTPKIVALQAKNRRAITVYIDSQGGATSSAETLIRLLSASDQSSSPPCRLITVVTSRAASAAADLLSSGAYAIAYPESAILCHGVRMSFDDPITVESASFLTESLRLSNDRYAMALANRSSWRFVFRYVLLKPKFNDFRNRQPKPVTDLQAFTGLLAENISRGAREVLRHAEKRNARYEDLVRSVTAAKKKKSSTFVNSPKRAADSEGDILKGVIDFERKLNKKNPSWTFSDGGLVQLSDDFLLLKEYLSVYESARLREQCERWGNFFLTKQDHEELETVPEPDKEAWQIDKIKPMLRPVWLFFVSLCHALQEGEHELTPADAYWFGLIDEVMGDGSLLCMRDIVEAIPDEPSVPAVSEPAAPEIAPAAEITPPA